MTETVYWIWFQQMFGFGTRRAELMMNYFAHPKEIYEGVRRGGKAAGMLTGAETAAVDPSMETAAMIEARTLKKGCDIITPTHALYPPRLQYIYSKPAVLYAKGDLSCLQDDAVAIAMVGTRKHSEYGKQAACELAAGIARGGAVVVSGLAKGVDTFCHQSALDAGGCTIGVLGCGLDIDYPKGNAELKTRMTKAGAVISEFPLGTQPMPGHFPIRNRIISGICNGTVVVEADFKSGSMLTVEHAQEQGRDIFAVPGEIFSGTMTGNHALLRDGAKPACCADDVLSEYGLSSGKKSEETLHNIVAEQVKLIEKPQQEVETAPECEIQLPETVSEDGRRLFDQLAGQEQSVDELARALKLEVGQVLVALTELELFGCIESLPGRRFARVR